MTGFTARNVTDQSGKTFIVTGANNGVGLETSHVLAKNGARVVLACRNEQKAEKAMHALRRATPDADLAFVKLDLADLDSIRDASKRLSEESRIDALVNNAGVTVPDLRRTKQGHELHWGVNHLGTFALTNLMLPKLAETAGSRVVITGSVVHFGAEIDWDDLDAHKSYKFLKRYSASKLANLLHLYELDRRLHEANSPVMAVGCHPGIAATGLGHDAKISKFVMPLIALTMNRPAQGAWPTLQAATSPDVFAGMYYGPQQLEGKRGPSGPAKRSKDAMSNELAMRLWDVSVEMTGTNAKLPVPA